MASRVVAPSFRVPGQAVSRSNELLACAKTALRLVQDQNQSCQKPAHNRSSNLLVTELHLYNSAVPSYSPDNFGDKCQVDENYHMLSPLERAIHDASQLLHVLDSLVAELQSLVRRRGHTNDPTEEIATCMKRFQTLMSEYVSEVELIPSTINSPANKGRNRQVSRHYEMVAQDLLSQGKQRAHCFQKSLEKRGEVLKEQAQRRKILRDGPSENGSGATTFAFETIVDNEGGRTEATRLNINQSLTSKPYGNLASFYSASSTSMQSDAPLFTQTSGTAVSLSRKKPAATAFGSVASSAMASSLTESKASTSQPEPPRPFLNSSGMRHRRKRTDGLADSAAPKFAVASTYASSTYSSAYRSAGNAHPHNYTAQPNPNAGNSQTQVQLQYRRQARETKVRLENARQAERAIHELGTMFSKMASLIHSQAQHIEKIEDDVELAQHDVSIGHEEITKLFDITKGNRLLIIKVFAILILMILFLRLY